MFDVYENPLCERYASREMQSIFSHANKFSTWRHLWLALAESQKELGLDISEEQIEELRKNVTNINYDVAEEKEREIRHDVMAHIYAYGVQCPKAKPIIHLGATSCFVGDNADIVIARQALALIKKLLINLIAKLAKFADEYKDLPTLAYTHFQAAQPTTLGKRASVWLQDLLFDLEQLDFVINSQKLLGCRGTTGTGASFLALFNGDRKKVTALERKIVAKMNFDSAYQVSGQTYPRKADYLLLSVLSSIAQSACKFSNDIRLLSHLKELEEPLENAQVGSSAMAYKRNPMRSERIASLARFVISGALNPALTASAQWLERTLDDSANRRIVIPQTFLAADAILSLYINIVEGLTVYPTVIEKNLRKELPFMATENILMHCVKKGGDRQRLHEAIRRHSFAVARDEHNLLKKIAGDEIFGISEEEMSAIISEDLTGMASEQTEDFLREVKKIIEKNKEFLGIEVEIKV